MNYTLIVLGLSLNIAFTNYLDVQFASFSYTIGGSYGSCVKFKKSEYSFGSYNACSCAWAANTSEYPNCHELYYNPQTKMIKYNLYEGGEYTYRSFANDYTCHIYEEETEPLECSEIDYELQCNQDSECNWVEDVETASCSSLPWDICDLPQYGSCYSDCTQWGTYYSAFCYGTMYCTGGTYQNDSSYCQESYIPGDANSDGSLNVSDVVLIVDSILNSQYNEYSDVNQDGVLSVIDIIDLINIILGD